MAIKGTNTPSKSKLRGCLSFLIRISKWILIILAALILVGIIYQIVASESDKRNYSPRGESFEVDGHKMHIVCKGSGSPTVVLQAGGVAESLWWYRIQNELAEHTQVCAYDRAGLGWSEPTSSPRDANTLTSELHTLLEKAGVEPPYIMVGHSFGAILSRIYTSKYPDEVKGIVLVDSALLLPKIFADENEYLSWKRANDPLQFIVWSLTRTGILRQIVRGDFMSFGYTEEIANEISALRSPNQVADTDYAERIPYMWDLQKASALAEKFGDIPLMVLWASSSNDVLLNDEAKTIYFGAKNELVTYSNNSVERTVAGSNHGSILGNEEYAKQVSQAILDTIKASESGTKIGDY